jgi:hypothetical protein
MSCAATLSPPPSAPGSHPPAVEAYPPCTYSVSKLRVRLIIFVHMFLGSIQKEATGPIIIIIIIMLRYSVLVTY